MKELKIVVLDDEQRVRDEIEEFLLAKQYSVFKASTPSEAFIIIDKENPHILILDIRLPEMDGIQVLQKVKKEKPELEIIMISGHGDMNSVIEAMRLGASDYFPKPFRLMEINNAIERTKRFIQLTTRLKNIEASNSLLSKELQDNIGHRLIGNSRELKKIIDLMTKVAKSKDTTVLVTGESGTGKELIARGIHYLGQRNKHYFHAVNCSAIPESLFESEFFGHKKGSFTGAIEDKAGWFEIANNGTLFLDEISDMPINQQAKLLRVLEEKKVSKVGSRVLTDVDVRVIAASNRDIDSMSEENKFRLDLYHRLSSFIIHIPPLRERREDIPLLIDHFIKEYGKRMNRIFKYIDPNIHKELINYSFPGNIRELKNMVERALIVSDSDELLLSHFQYKSSKMIEEKSQLGTTDFNLESTEKMLIIKALEASENNKSKAANLLNISWQSLDRRLKKFEISLN